MGRVKLLIVDDKPENLVALEELVRATDREVFTASSGNDALRLLLKHDFAVVLLDVEMPIMDGYETAQLMKGSERTRLVPIIFVTAGDRSEERTFRGYEAGAVDYLYKPVNAYILKSKVDIFVDLYHKAQELATTNAALARTTITLQGKVTDLENVNRTLSHDLRAPLRSIRAFSAALAESLAGKLDPESQDYLDRVLRAGERMTRMVDDLFALLKVGAIEDVSNDVELAKVLDEVLENQRSDLEAAGGRVTRDDLPTVRGHKGVLAQILENMIANAIKFRSAAALHIHVSATSLASAWQIGVHDNGIGIAPAYRERIFGLFERLGDTTPGTGVGLALCKRAVEKLRGRIWVEEAANGGSSFYFTIPR